MTKKWLQHRFQSTLHRAGLHLTRYAATVHSRRSKLLRTTGTACLVDIGANRGQYAGEVRTHGYDGRLVSLEPVSDAFAELQTAAARDPLWEVRKAAVGANVGTIEILVSERDIYSSALPVLQQATSSDSTSRAVRTEMVALETLDGIAQDLEGPLGVKIDVQGFESSVLDGGLETLARACYLEMELTMVPLYEGQMLYLEGLQRVTDLGFVLAMTEPLFPNPHTGQAMQMNGLFVRA